MQGIVSGADLVGVVQQTASKDIQKIGGMEALEQMLTATALGYFSDEIEKAVVLALFLPLIISSGGTRALRQLLS
jgi:magnesium transporter